MKKLIILFLFFCITTNMFSQKKIILIVGDDDYYTDVDIKIKDIIESMPEGFDVTLVLTKDIAEVEGNYDYSAYDAAIISETTNWVFSRHYGVNGPKTLPTLCLEPSALRDDLPIWGWINHLLDIDNTGYFDQITSYTDYTKEKVVSNHTILKGLSVNDEFSISSSLEEGAGERFRTFRFDSSAFIPIRASATPLLESVWAADNLWNIKTNMFAIEENDSSKRAVIWGIRAGYLFNGEYPLFWEIIKNSVRWITKSETNSISSTDLNSNELHFSVYPNPATDKLNLETEFLDSKTKISIYTVEGKKLISRSLYKRYSEIDISHLKSGLYIISLSSDNNVSIGKILKH